VQESARYLARSVWPGFVELIPIVREYVIPLCGGQAGHQRDHWHGLAQIEDFVGHAGLDVDEIAGLVFQHLLESVAKFMAQLPSRMWRMDSKPPWIEP
jgi:hypothetical protein